MEINFYLELGDHSNAGLIKIIRNAEQYQPEAVAAARLLLQEREVSEEDERKGIW